MSAGPSESRYRVWPSGGGSNKIKHLTHKIATTGGTLGGTFLKPESVGSEGASGVDRLDAIAEPSISADFLAAR
jgi:hypothetical protein